MEMQEVRSFLFDVVWVIWTIILSPRVLFLYLTNASSATVRRFSLFWARGTLYLLHRVVGLDFIEIGRENVADRPMLIVCNHQSVFETIALPMLLPNATFVSKIELTRIPIFGWCLKKYPMILIDRAAGARAIFRQRDEDDRQNEGAPVEPHRSAPLMKS